MGSAMTSYQSNKLAMYTATLGLLKSSDAQTSSMPVFAESQGKFEDLVAQIKNKDKERIGKTTGKSAAKDEAEDALVTATVMIAAGLTAFARKKGNTQLKEKAKVSESYLRRIRSHEQVNIAKLTYDLALANAEGLVEYSITPSMLSDFKSRIAAYEAAIEDIGTGMASRVGARTAVGDLFIQVDDLLKEELDPMMELFRMKEPELYNDYHAARVIKDIGIRHKKGDKKVVSGSPN